jgi:hypothetical protein
MDRRSRARAIRAAQAASWAYVLLVVAICGFLCLFILMPGQLLLLFVTGVQDTATIRMVRGYVESSRVGAWKQAWQVTISSCHAREEQAT